MNFLKSIILTLLILPVFFTCVQAQNNAFNVEITSTTIDCGDNTYSIGLEFSLAGTADYEYINVDLELGLHPDLYNNWENVSLTFCPFVTGHNGTYIIRPTVGLNKLTLFLEKPLKSVILPCGGGVMSLVPMGGRIVRDTPVPPFISNAGCNVLASLSTTNCTGYAPSGPISDQVLAGNTDIIPFSCGDDICGINQNRIGLLQQELKISPNPVQNWLSIENTSSSSILLMDSKGTLVKEIQLNVDQTSVRIDMSELPAGMYLIKVGSKVQKLIKL